MGALLLCYSIFCKTCCGFLTLHSTAFFKHRNNKNKTLLTESKLQSRFGPTDNPDLEYTSNDINPTVKKSAVDWKPVSIKYILYKYIIHLPVAPYIFISMHNIQLLYFSTHLLYHKLIQSQINFEEKGRNSKFYGRRTTHFRKANYNQQIR